MIRGWRRERLPRFFVAIPAPDKARLREINDGAASVEQIFATSRYCVCRGSGIAVGDGLP